MTGKISFPRLPETASNPVSDAILSYRRVRTEIARMNASCAQAAQEMAQGNFDVLSANSCVLYFSPAIQPNIKNNANILDVHFCAKTK